MEVGTKFAVKFCYFYDFGEIVRKHELDLEPLYTVKMEKSGYMLVAFVKPDSHDFPELAEAGMAMNPCAVSDYESEIDLLKDIVYNEDYVGGVLPIAD